MTALETLAKYGLKTDIATVKKRLTEDDYMIMSAEMCIDGGKFEKHEITVIAKVIKFCDIQLLCSLAEKGERYEKVRKMAVESKDVLVDGMEEWETIKGYGVMGYNNYSIPRIAVDNAFERFDEIITEAEGEGK